MSDPAASHFRTAWRSFKLHPGIFILSMLILFASWVALELAVVSLHRYGALPSVVLHLAFLVLFSGLMVGFHGMALRVVDGQAPHLVDMTALLRRGPACLLAFCVYLAAVIVGLGLLVAPGVYVAVRYALFGQVLATRPASALESLRGAAALSRGRWGRVCGLLLKALALNLAGAALMGVGLLVTFPVSLLAAAGLHRALERAP